MAISGRWNHNVGNYSGPCSIYGVASKFCISSCFLATGSRGQTVASAYVSEVSNETVLGEHPSLALQIAQTRSCIGVLQGKVDIMFILGALGLVRLAVVRGLGVRTRFVRHPL